MISHRHLDYPAGTAPDALPAAAVADILDRGDLADWAPLAAEVSRRPDGELARRIWTIADSAPMYGTSPLWRSWITQCRARATGATRATGGTGATEVPCSLAQLRRGRGLTQAEVATRMRISQSDVSKLERRHDVRLSTLRAYLAALGTDTRVVAVSADGATEVRL